MDILKTMADKQLEHPNIVKCFRHNELCVGDSNDIKLVFYF